MAYEDERQQQPQQQSSVGSAIQVGTLLGAGTAGVVYRRQIGTGLRNVAEMGGALTSAGVGRMARSVRLRETMGDIGTFTSALNFGADGRGVISHIKNPERFERRFNESLHNSIEARGRMRRTELGGESLSVAEEMDKLRSAIQQTPKLTFESQRMMHISKRLEQDMPEQAKDIEALLKLHNKGNQGQFLDDVTPLKVKAFTERLKDPDSGFQHKLQFKDEAEQDKFEQTLFKALDDYKDYKTSKGWQDKDARQNLKKTTKKNIQNMTDDFLEKYNKYKLQRDEETGMLKRDGRGKVMKEVGKDGKVLLNTKHQDAMLARIMKHQDAEPATLGDLVLNGKNLLATEIDAMRKTPVKAKNREGKWESKEVDNIVMQKMSKLVERNSDFEDLIADPHLLKKSTGNEFIDTRWMTRGSLNLMDGFRNSVHVPFLRFNPLDLLHFSTWEGIKKAPNVAFKKMGTIDPGLHGSVEELKHPLANNQDAAVGILSRNYMNTSNGNVYDMTTGELAKTDVYQASGRFGMMPRAMAAMSNLHIKDYSNRSKLGKLFDIGRQETESVPNRMFSVASKFQSHEWGPNLLSALKRHRETDGLEGLDEESVFKLAHSQLEQKTQILSDDTVSYINSHVKNAYGDIGIDLTDLDTEDKIMSALTRLNDAILTPNSGIARVSDSMGGELQGIDRLIHDTWNKYERNPYAFLDNQRIKPNNAPYLPEWGSALDMSETDLIGKADDVKRLIQQHASRQLEFATGTSEKLTVGKLVQQGMDEGVLGAKALQEVNHLETLTSVRQYWDDIYRDPDAKADALNKFADRVLDESDPLSYTLQSAMTDFNPNWAMGAGQEPPQYFGFVDSLSMNKAKGYQWALKNHNEKIAEGQSPTAALMDSLMGVVSQPFAGRRNTGNVTTATMPFYYLAERLDNAVAQLGIGLSQQNRGSMQSIVMNQFGRRIVLPYVAYQQAMWADGMTGDFFSDKAAESYANMHEDVGHVKEILGFNDIGRQWSRVFGGADQLAEMPVSRAFNFATFGLFQHQSGEEIRDFYESGEVAVRKGRYWGVGSNTPYTGGKIDRYVPNWYRRIKSDYKMTETLYGSESEYWANHWMPTVTNPLAPIRHFFTDPYHYEKKHEETRPYAMTGGFAEVDMIPLVGPALNNTVGRLLKPRREHPDLEKAHRAYIEEINQNIKNQYEMAGEGGLLQGMPAGGFGVTQGGLGTEEGTETGYGGIAGVTPEQYQMMMGGAGGATGDARAQLAAVNNMYSEIGGPSLGATGKSVRSITALEDLRDPDVLANLTDIDTMYSASGTARDTFYLISEMAGIYGFSTKTMMGFEESGRGMTLEQSTRMSSYARAFWDMELGGLGGQLSEIGRRYNPRDPNKNYWNPIKNQMPDWLPGSEYFTDFKHGDPYVKIANGEMRLPGEAYETLYKLHPDALSQSTGSNYGTFDRFRILADVAPYSENYKFYRNMVSKMNQAGMLDEEMKAEYAEVRDQVSSRKKKHRFYTRRFDNAEVNYETVTITRMLDATTFLTKEHPNNPIKMAGVGVKADDMETQEWLQQYVHEGARVRIAVDADPLFRVRDDQFNTMRAVVYANKNPEGTMLPYGTKGQNVNFMLANRKSGGLFGTGIMGESTVTTKDDGSATATQALFSKDMITVGRLWEFTTHDVLPKIPIIGTLADKFMQIRSPLEMYKRNEVYGKAWRPWQQPIEGWIRPMMETMASSHPIVGAAQGAGIGWLFTRRQNARFFGTRIGAIIGGGVSTARVFIEQGNKLSMSDEPTWLPERRKKEREINEYFDKLKYVKYHGLYEKAKRVALEKEGVDVDALIAEHEERGAGNKSKRNFLNSMKKQLSMSKKLGYGDKEAVESQLDELRDELKLIDQDRPSQQIGEHTMLALRYKEEYESTLHGADENGDMTKIFRALPSKDREFFTEFMKAAPKEREEILRLVPKDQRRFYQAKWGMDVDEPEDLRHYFSEHHLPDEKWEGWRPDTSLENYKIKVVKNEALEMTEFNYWDDDVQRAEQSNAQRLPMQSLTSRLDVHRLEKALRGAGLKDVSVSVNATTGQSENKVELAMDILKDRSNDIVTEINNNLGGLFG